MKTLSPEEYHAVIEKLENLENCINNTLKSTKEEMAVHTLHYVLNIINIHKSLASLERDSYGDKVYESRTF